MTVLIDNGHGQDTAGKRSVDHSLREWEYTRKIAKKVVAMLLNNGIKAQLLTPEEYDVSLIERVSRQKKIAKTDKTILVSIHCDADGMGEIWTAANGFSVRVSPNASASSRMLAGIVAKKASEYGLRVRRPRPTQDYWEQNLYICKNTSCPAILTENLFMTNKNDVEYLMSDAGIQTITYLHVEAIVEYIKQNSL